MPHITVHTFTHTHPTHTHHVYLRSHTRCFGLGLPFTIYTHTHDGFRERRWEGEKGRRKWKVGVMGGDVIRLFTHFACTCVHPILLYAHKHQPPTPYTIVTPHCGSHAGLRCSKRGICCAPFCGTFAAASCAAACMHAVRRAACLACSLALFAPPFARRIWYTSAAFCLSCLPLPALPLQEGREEERCLPIARS